MIKANSIVGTVSLLLYYFTKSTGITHENYSRIIYIVTFTALVVETLYMYSRQLWLKSQ